MGTKPIDYDMTNKHASHNFYVSFPINVFLVCLMGWNHNGVDLLFPNLPILKAILT